ncbi:MAG: PilZ domain-containing protein [Lachnospiraceae bacterium]|nr:PilZ domain-containing protein [Lachnospiraceae bacterium]
MEERRQINRVEYPTKSVIVVCDTMDKYFVETENVSPLGMGLKLDKSAPDLTGKDIIIVAETLIMYATVVRQETVEDGSYKVGIHAKRFTADVLQYLFDSITPGLKED